MNCYPVCEPITPPCMSDVDCGPEGYCVNGGCEGEIEPDAKPGKHRAAARPRSRSSPRATPR